ncbi:MAG: hypothetical protein WBX25_13985 [Rhodomicrobium sp.]
MPKEGDWLPWHSEYLAFDHVIGVYEAYEELAPFQLPLLLNEVALYNQKYLPVTTEEVLTILTTSREPLPEYLRTRAPTKHLRYSDFDSYGALAWCILNSLKRLEEKLQGLVARMQAKGVEPQ